MNEPKKKKPNYFDYDQIVSIFFGSTETVYRIFDLRKEEWELHPARHQLAACLYQSDLFESHDDYEFISFGWDAKKKAKDKGAFYVDKLSDKVQHLFTVEPNIKTPLKQAKDKLYQRAVVQYFKNLIEKLVDDNEIVPSKRRYLVTYPSHWTLEQAAYLRSLLQMAGIVDELDHLDRLIMYNEGDAILRHIQDPSSNFPNMGVGQKYMICNLSGTKVEMHLYDIKGPIDFQSMIKSVNRCNWYNGSVEDPAQMYLRKGDAYPETILYLSSILSTHSIEITVKDLESMLNTNGSVFKDWWDFKKIERVTEYSIENNISTSYVIPQSLHVLYYERLNNLKKSTTEQIPQWIEDGYIKLYPREIKEKVLKPVCDRIIQYMKKIIQTVTDNIDDVILVDSYDHAYLMGLLADEYKETTKWKMYQIYPDYITNGALLKCLDNLTAFDIYKPKIVHDDLALYTEPGITKTQNVIILIDYGLEKTGVSYIHTQSGQIADDANIKHILDWPGQYILNRDFPTLNVMLIPNYPLNIRNDSKINRWWQLNLFSNFLSRKSCKAMFILQKENGYNQKISTPANTIFYTFEKDEYGIILITHQSEIIEELSVAVVTANSASSSYNATRKRISFQEFSLMFFEYLADFLHTYISSETGVEKNNYRYCITYNNNGYPQKFTLSNKDIRQIALKSNLISADIPTSLLVLELAEATAIYCRKLIDTTIANKEETHIYFLQVQLHPNQCLLILNTVPFLDHDDSNSYRENGEPWECLHKNAKTKNIPINFMDNISENLWIYMQKIGSSILRKCEQHQAQKKFFNSKNMQIFKNMIYDYILTTKDLNLEDSEKEINIRICDKDSSSCCYLATTNMNFLESAFNPAIDKIVSIVQSSIFNQDLFQAIQISDIFVMGEFLHHQDFVSYKYLEDMLLAKLRNLHFPRFDNLILQSMTKKTQVKKLNGREYQQIQDGSVEDRNDSITQISTRGSIMFSIDPRNLLVERLADKTYVVQLDFLSFSDFTWDYSGRALDGETRYHIIMLKGTSLNSLSLIEDTINKHFMITEYNDKSDFILNIYLLVKENDNVSYLTDINIDEDSWFDKHEDTNFEELTAFRFFSRNFDNPSYPFSFMSRLSRTERFMFWVDQGKNSKEEIKYIRDPIILKSCHNE